MEEFDYSNLKHIAKINGNNILLKDGGYTHFIGNAIQTQEELELEDLEIDNFIKFIKKKNK